MAEIFFDANSIKKELIYHRRNLHKIAEKGFELTKTVEYIWNALAEIGCKPYRCGNNGIYTVIGNVKSDECVLLRADMDALPIKEETDLDFKSNENMHACGHDMHSAMLIGAARILKMRENELIRPVKLLFQPAEETLQGAKNMIDNGILENPKVTAAFMIHVIVNTPMKTGRIIVGSGGVGAPATEYFEIEVVGKGCHGAIPNSGVDPIIAASNIVSALDAIKTRELSLYDNSVLTTGSVSSGTAYNVIPDRAIIKGSFRSFDMGIQAKIKKSVIRISQNISKAYNCTSEINFPTGCPCLINNNSLSKKVFDALSGELDKQYVIGVDEINSESKIEQRSAGSEDFSYISQKIPSLMLALSAGSSEDGFCYPLHHPKVLFDENCLVFGTAAFALIGLKL